ARVSTDQTTCIVQNMSTKKDGAPTVGHDDAATVDYRGGNAHFVERNSVCSRRPEHGCVRREGRRDESADVDLGGLAEDDAILVEQENRAGSLDGTKNLARIGIHDLIERDVPGTLVEPHRCIFA